MTIALEHLVERLEHLSEEPGLDPDLPMIDLPIDSLVLMEWLYEVEDTTGVPMLEVFQDGADLDELSLRSFHARVVGWAEAVAS